MDYVFQLPSNVQSKLKAVLDADPYAERGFARLGYFLKDAKVLGVGEGLILAFKCDEALAKELLPKLDGFEKKRVEGDEAARILKAIQDEEDNATAGVGSMFG